MRITVRTARFLQVLLVLAILFSATAAVLVSLPDRNWVTLVIRILGMGLWIYWFGKLENHIYDEQHRKVQDGRTD